MKSIEQIKDLAEKKVILRVDFNVRVNKNGEVDKDEAFKIEAALPTIKYLLDKRAKIVLISHLGRPKGKIVPELKLDAAADHLSKLLKKLVRKVNGAAGASVKKATSRLKAGELLMLENVRFEEGEEKNDLKLAKSLAELGDIFVNEAFGVCHREAASVSGITKFLPSYAGFLLQAEISALEKVMNKPKKPLLVIMGGLKFETKLPVIEKLLPKADKILLGGGLASTCLKALGYGVGDSIVDDEYLPLAKKIAKNKKILLPLDLIVGRKEGGCEFEHLPVPVKPYKLIDSPVAIYDVGPETIQAWSKLIRKVNTLIWNGPLGNFEQPPYNHGTIALARLIAARSKGRAFGVVGGGETISALRQSKMAEYIDHVSTGGGAMLEFLAGKKLPGIEALK